MKKRLMVSMFRRVTAVASLCAVTALSSCAAPTTDTQPSPSELRTARDIVQEFALIASENEGNRGFGSPGGFASGNLIIKYLNDMGADPSIHPVTRKDGTTGRNITADIVTGSGEGVVVIGTPYDSGYYGPGIAKNASGVAALIAAARSVIGEKAEKTIRIAFWDGSNQELLGSNHYVAQIPHEERAKYSYINVDMAASINPKYVLLDGARSSLPAVKETDPEYFHEVTEQIPPVPSGSEELDAYIEEAYHLKGEMERNFRVSMSMDSAPFIRAGIPTSGVSVFSAPEDTRSPSEFTTCYNRDCDNKDNINYEILENSVISIEKLMKILISGPDK